MDTTKLVDKLIKQIQENKNNDNEKENISIWDELNKKLVEHGIFSVNKNPRTPEDLINKETIGELKSSKSVVQRIAFYVYRISQIIPPINEKFQELSEKLEEIASSINKEEMLAPERVEDILLFMLELGIGSELGKSWAGLIRAKIENEDKNLDLDNVIEEVKDRVTESIRKELEKESKEILKKEREILIQETEKESKKKIQEWKQQELGEIYEQAYKAIQEDKENKNKIIDCLLMNSE